MGNAEGRYALADLNGNHQHLCLHGPLDVLDEVVVDQASRHSGVNTSGACDARLSVSASGW